MLSVLTTAAKNALLTSMGTALGSGGTCELQSSGGTVLAILTGVTFGSPSGGTVTVTATADSSNDATGTANKLVLKTSGGTATYEIPNADVTWGPSTAVTSGGTATLTSFTIGVN